jgi:Flp pilus assembly protein TadB
MKLPSLFTKTPNYKRFAYTPRHFDPLEEERKEREERIRHELSIEAEKKSDEENLHAYRSRIAGSFRTAKKTATVQKDPSANMLRLIILMVLTIGLIAFIEYGKVALYGVAIVIIPFYFYLKFRKFRR